MYLHISIPYISLTSAFVKNTQQNEGHATLCTAPSKVILFAFKYLAHPLHKGTNEVSFLEVVK